MSTNATKHRAAMLDKRLTRAFDTPIVFDDVTGHQVFPREGLIDLAVTFSNGTSFEWSYSDAENAYDVAADARARVERICLSIRKARHERKGN
jgi:hypothetical protein